MRKGTKILLWVGGGLVLLVVIAIAVAFFYLNSSAGKQFLKDKVAEALPQASFEMEDMDVGLFPPRVRLSKLSLADKNGGDPIIELGEFGAAVPLGSLLGGGGTVVKSLEVSDLKVHIVQKEDGGLNIEALLPGERPEDEKPTEEPKPIVIEKIALKNASIYYEAFGNKVELSGYGCEGKLRIDEANPENNDVQLTCAWDSFKASGALAPGGELSRVAFDATKLGTITLKGNKLSVDGLETSFHVEHDGWTVDVAGWNCGASITIPFSPDELSLACGWNSASVSGPLGPNGDNETLEFGETKLGAISVAGDVVLVEDLELAVDGQVLRGRFELDQSGGSILPKFALRLQGLLSNKLLALGGLDIDKPLPVSINAKGEGYNVRADIDIDKERAVALRFKLAEASDEKPSPRFSFHTKLTLPQLFEGIVDEWTLDNVVLQLDAKGTLSDDFLDTLRTNPKQIEILYQLIDTRLELEASMDSASGPMGLQLSELAFTAKLDLVMEELKAKLDTVSLSTKELGKLALTGDVSPMELAVIVQLDDFDTLGNPLVIPMLGMLLPTEVTDLIAGKINAEISFEGVTMTPETITIKKIERFTVARTGDVVEISSGKEALADDGARVPFDATSRRFRLGDITFAYDVKPGGAGK